jgi:AcrR family transcriptional regulator
MTAMAVEKWTPERRRERTRDALLDAAVEVFVKRGFAAASLDEIAETAGYTRGAIYKHFDGKQDLFFGVVDRVNERALAEFAARLEGDTNVVHDLDEIVRIWQTDFSLNRDLLVIGLEVYLYALRNPEVRERSREHLRRTTDVVTEFMERQAEAHGFRTRLPIRTLAQIFLISSDGFAQTMQIDSDAAGLYRTFLDLMISAAVEYPDEG